MAFMTEEHEVRQPPFKLIGAVNRGPHAEVKPNKTIGTMLFSVDRREFVELEAPKGTYPVAVLTEVANLLVE